ncbi:hypothetical protein AVEN_81817-1 [Araneus ventricosus]|uniref:Uncharacterized protein n=1 Tax=Araneus ventricosus TaxID=182803 RepID=A0A4Y2GJL8_ARAVE|nr:hypothetical protein AVEN_81817-1 [Araneus ventricosus]
MVLFVLVGEFFFNLFWFDTSLKSVTSGEAKASSLTGATDGGDGIGKLVIQGDAFAVESHSLELRIAETPGFFSMDGAENEFFATETQLFPGVGVCDLTSVLAS